MFCREDGLAREPAQKLALVHAILEGFPAIDKNDRHFVVELAAKLGVAIDIYFLPFESAAPRQLRETFFHHLAQMASFARVNNDLTGEIHDLDSSVPRTVDSTEKL